MATTFPTYPATTFEQAVELSIFASNQLHNVINGDATTTIETENGDIPSVRKALVDNFFFKTPIKWVSGETSEVFNQLYYFYDDEVVNGWYYAPSATLDNPVALGDSPVGDDNWVLYSPVSKSVPAQVYPWYTEITTTTSSISPPYTFDTAIVVYNSAVLTANKDYTITDSVITFTPPLDIEPEAEYPDILFCYLGKVEEGNPETNYVTYENLSKTSGSGLIGFDHKTSYPSNSIARLAIANFQDEQPIQYYYDNNGGDWDEAIFEAQMAVYLYGFSPKLRLPHGRVEIYRDVLGGVALGDYIHQRYPDLNFYDSTTGNYAAVWPLHLEGTYLYASDYTLRNTLGTQLVRIYANNTDTSGKDTGIVHCGPTEYGQVRRTDSVVKKWPGNGLVIRNLNIAAATSDGSLYPWTHGIYTFGSAKNLIENVVVSNCWGAGILFDWVFDSLVKNVRVMGCGRMQTKNYFTLGNTSADYQLYAPIQTLFSPGSNVSDNTNFIRFEGCHLEDNYVAADIIIAGTASPVWITDPHFECATVASTSAGASTKSALCTGGFGVRYFMEDSQSDWDTTVATVRVNAGQGNVIWRGGGIYSPTYEYQVQQAGFGTTSVESNLFPNQGNIRQRTSSTGARFIGINSNLGNITCSGGNSNTTPLILDGCASVGIISMSYTHPAKLSNTRATALVVTNPFTSEATPWTLDNCTFDYINMATVANAMGNIYLVSTTIPSTFRTGLGKLTLAYYAYFATNLSGALQSTKHESQISVTTTTNSALLVQEGSYEYPANNVTSSTGLYFTGRQILDVVNNTPNSYVIQTSKGIATGGYLQCYRIIPYSGGSYGTPSAWKLLTTT